MIKHRNIYFSMQKPTKFAYNLSKSIAKLYFTFLKYFSELLANYRLIHSSSMIINIEVSKISLNKIKFVKKISH